MNLEKAIKKADDFLPQYLASEKKGTTPRYYWRGVPLNEVVKLLKIDVTYASIISKIAKLRLPIEKANKRELTREETDAITDKVMETILTEKKETIPKYFKGYSLETFCKKERCYKTDVQKAYKLALTENTSEAAKIAVEYALKRKEERMYEWPHVRFGAKFQKNIKLDMLFGEKLIPIKLDNIIKYYISNYGRVIELDPENTSYFRTINPVGNTISDRRFPISYTIGNDTISEEINIQKLYPQFFIGKKPPTIEEVKAIVKNKSTIDYKSIITLHPGEDFIKLFDNTDKYGITRFGIIGEKINGINGAHIYTPLNKFGEWDKEITFSEENINATFTIKELYEKRFRRSVPTPRLIQKRVEAAKYQKLENPKTKYHLQPQKLMLDYDPQNDSEGEKIYIEACTRYNIAKQAALLEYLKTYQAQNQQAQKVK